MNHIQISTSSKEKLNIAKDAILNQVLLYEKDSETLYIKFNDKLIPLGGSIKQDTLEAGDNIEFIDDEDNTNDQPVVVRLKDDIDINTCTLSPDGENTYNWKGTIKLGELSNNNILFILMKKTAVGEDIQGIVGGEILLKMIDDNGEESYGHYALTCTSTGSWSLKGASSTTTSVRMCILKQTSTGDYFYGLKVPSKLLTSIESHEEEYQEEEQVLVEHTQNGNIYINKLNTNTLTRNYYPTSWYFNQYYNSQGVYSLHIGYKGTTGINLTDTQYYNGYNSWVYCSFKSFFDYINMTPQRETTKEWYNNNYYLYLYVYRRFDNQGNLGFRVTAAAICSQIMSSNFDESSNGVVTYMTPSNQGSNWNWNEEVFTNSSYTNINGNENTSISLVDIEEPYTTTETQLVTKTRTVTTTTTSEKNPKSTEIWFNGWNEIPEELKATDYNDTQFSYTVLSDKSNDNDSFAETFYCSASEVAPKIRVIQDTGEDNAPYKFIVSGTISMTDLQDIANLCRDPERQIYLDMSQATVDDTATQWGKQLFTGCSALRGLILPQGVVSITECVFIWCTYLRYLDLTPSSGTLTTLGASSGYGTSVGFLTSTRVRYLMIPSSVNKIQNYLIGSSNIRNLIFLHEGNNPLEINQWAFMIFDSTSTIQETVPDNFHVYVTQSWYEGFIKSNWTENNASLAYQWNNEQGWWTKTMVDNLVIIEPSWSQNQWQDFNDKFLWGESLINEVRARLGYPNSIEIKE